MRMTRIRGSDHPVCASFASHCYPRMNHSIANRQPAVMDGAAGGVAASARAREERCTQAFRLPRSPTPISHSAHLGPYRPHHSLHMSIVRILAQIHLHCQLAFASPRTQQGPPRSPSRPNTLWARNNTRLSCVSQPRTQHRGGPCGTAGRSPQGKNKQHARRASFRNPFLPSPASTEPLPNP